MNNCSTVRAEQWIFVHQLLIYKLFTHKTFYWISFQKDIEHINTTQHNLTELHHYELSLAIFQERGIPTNPQSPHLCASFFFKSCDIWSQFFHREVSFPRCWPPFKGQVLSQLAGTYLLQLWRAKPFLYELLHQQRMENVTWKNEKRNNEVTWQTNTVAVNKHHSVHSKGSPYDNV